MEFFEKQIRPILVERCYECHSAEKKTKGGLALDTRAATLKGGDTGPAIVAGDPAKSLLIEAVRYHNRDLQMPPKNRLSESEIKFLEEWVKMGAPDPRTAAAPANTTRTINLEEGRKFWSFTPLARAEPPAAPAGTSPIDAFLQAKLRERGLTPAPPADKRTLLRRATFDLIGLPPTPAEVEAFVADSSPDAFERVIERLLASPHYGERWGRHWLDVARYADSNGMDENVAFGHAWRYRDYVVRAFNDDKPYDEFLIEQLAGDLLPPREDAITATGFLALGARVLAEPDLQKLEMDIIDEQIDTVGKAFLGMTLGCARCHDHKFDPVSTEDYYALGAIFRSTRSLAADNTGTIKYWHEHSLATPAQLAELKKFEETVKAKKAAIAAFTKEARAAAPKAEAAPDAANAGALDSAAQARLDAMNKELADFEAKRPETPGLMSVADAAIARTLPIHIRGSYLTLGKPVERGFPAVMRAGLPPPILPAKRSGRLELARWMASGEHPLTARVMVNRVWRWHFGQGIVGSPDNFGLLGARPSHPELLDWLARTFIESGWSVKDLHRLVMKSAAYRQASRVPPPAAGQPDPTLLDPENRLLWRSHLQRLEAEQIRDAMLAASGWLNLELGGKTIPRRNREFVFNHTSKDATTYETARRALYLPIIRNHLYDMLEQFDYPDPASPSGDRKNTVIAPQALIMMNAPLVAECGRRLAERLASLPTDEARLAQAYQLLYARPPTSREAAQSLALLHDLSANEETGRGWSLLCETLFAANEFIYLR